MLKLVAEIGSNHNRDLNRCMKLIEEAKKLNFWGVKFQLFKAEKLTEDKKLQKKYKEQELPIEWIPKIRKKCDELKINFGCSVFYPKAIKELKCVDFLKISSFDILRLNLIEDCILTGKPVVISCGLATKKDINNVIDLIDKRGNKNVTYYLLHCTSEYPTKLKDINLVKVRKLFSIIAENKIKDKYILPGYSLHTRDVYVMIECINFLCQMIEMHFDLDDKKGSESSLGHCWTPNDINVFHNFLYQRIQIHGENKDLTEKQLNIRANAITGFRN